MPSALFIAEFHPCGFMHQSIPFRVVTGKVKYSNAVSRLVLPGLFHNQWVIPEEPSGPATWFFRWYEKNLMNVDTSAIRIDSPVFIISLPRSGSSMLQDVLCSHRSAAFINNGMHIFRTCFCGADHFRKRLGLDAGCERFLGDSVMVRAGSPADPVASWLEWLKLNETSLGFVERRTTDLAPADIDAMLNTIRRIIWCFGNGPHHFICKTPFLLPHVVFLQEIFPDARFIHLVRDGRMCANSLCKLQRLCAEQLRRLPSKRIRDRYADKPFVPFPRLPGLEENVRKYGPDDVRTTALLWREGIRFFNERRHLLKHVHEVRYEDIVADPQTRLSRLFEFCGLGKLDEADASVRDQIASIGSIRHTNKYGNFDVIEEICRPEMARYGYTTP